MPAVFDLAEADSLALAIRDRWTMEEKARPSGSGGNTKLSAVQVQRLSALRMMLAGGSPGLWASNHYEELQHMTGWTYVAVHAFALQFAGARISCFHDEALDRVKRQRPKFKSRLEELQYRLQRLRGELPPITKSLQPVESSGSKKRPLPAGHPLCKLMAHPNPEMSGAQHRYQIAQQLGLTGKAIVWSIRDHFDKYDRRGRVVEQYIIPTGLAQPQAPSYQFPEGWYRCTPSVSWTINVDEDGFTPGSPIGNLLMNGGDVDRRECREIAWPHPIFLNDSLSPLSACAVQIDIAEEIDRAIWSRFKNEHTPGLVFSFDKELAKLMQVATEEIEAWRVQMRARNAGTANTGRDMLLPPGITAESHNPNPKEMDFANTRPQARDGVFTAHMTPATVAGAEGVANYSALYAQAEQYVQYKIQPNLDMAFEEISADVCPAFGPGYSIKAEARSMPDKTLEGERKNRLNTHKAVTVDEAREQDGMPPYWDQEYGKLPVGTTWQEYQQIKNPQPQPGQMPGQPGQEQGGMDGLASLFSGAGDGSGDGGDGSDKDSTGIPNPTKQAVPGRSDVLGKAHTNGHAKERHRALVNRLEQVLEKAETGRAVRTKGFNPAAKLRDAGEKLKQSGQAMPGYGQIFLKKNGSGEAWYVGGDGDERGFDKLVKESLTEVEGIDEVRYESEYFPPRDGTWMQVYPAEKPWEKAKETDKPNKYATTQLDIPNPWRSQIAQLAAGIPQSDLAGDGIPSTPHVTALYGLHTDKPQDVFEAVRGFGPLRLTLGNASLFQNEDADVLKIDVASPDLQKLNKLLRDSLPHTQTHANYSPHLTIAYLKPGLGNKWLHLGNELNGAQLEFDHLIYSDRERKQQVIPLKAVAAQREIGKLPIDAKSHIDTVDQWLANPQNDGIPAEAKVKVGATLKDAMRRMPAAMLDRAMANMEPVLIYKSMPGRKRGGAFEFNRDTGKGRLHLDHDYPGEHEIAVGAHLHELGHAVDGAETFSSTPEWQAAFSVEIDRPEDPDALPDFIDKSAKLSRYARTNPAEGFAEYVRACCEMPDKARQQFPQCWTFAVNKGLVQDPILKAADVESIVGKALDSFRSAMQPADPPRVEPIIDQAVAQFEVSLKSYAESTAVALNQLRQQMEQQERRAPAPVPAPEPMPVKSFDYLPGLVRITERHPTNSARYRIKEAKLDEKNRPLEMRIVEDRYAESES